MNDAEEERRIVIRVRVTDLPGDPYRRHTTLAELLHSNKVISRPIKPEITRDGYDGIVIPPDFYSDKPISRYFAFDLNVKGPKTKEELLDVPHFVYLACKLEEGAWQFVPRDGWIEKVKSHASSWAWGGRAEQKWLAEARQSDS